MALHALYAECLHHLGPGTGEWGQGLARAACLRCRSAPAAGRGRAPSRWSRTKRRPQAAATAAPLLRPTAPLAPPTALVRRRRSPNRCCAARPARRRRRPGRRLRPRAALPRLRPRRPRRRVPARSRRLRRRWPRRPPQRLSAPPRPQRRAWSGARHALLWRPRPCATAAGAGDATDRFLCHVTACLHVYIKRTACQPAFLLARPRCRGRQLARARGARGGRVRGHRLIGLHCAGGAAQSLPRTGPYAERP